MLNWKLINWTIAICFVGLNFLGIGLSHQRRQSDAASEKSRMELRSRQADQLAIWHGSPTLSFSDSSCLSEIRQLGPAVELETVPGSVDLTWEDLPVSQAKDLPKAIHGLMQTYDRDGAKHVLSYMRSRGESLDEGKIANLRKYMVKRHGLSEEDLTALSLRDEFTLYWDVLNSTAGWKAFVPQHSGIHLWQSDSVTEGILGDVATLSEADKRLWQSRSDRYHFFSNPTDSPSSQMTKHGSIQVADVRLILEHDGKGVHTICPYAIRFWYSNDRQKWIPHLLAIYATSKDIPSSLMF